MFRDVSPATHLRRRRWTFFLSDSSVRKSRKRSETLFRPQFFPDRPIRYGDRRPDQLRSGSEVLETRHLGSGTAFTAELLGRNAIALAVRTDAPSIVKGPEHQSLLFNDWTGICSPIRIGGKSFSTWRSPIRRRRFRRSAAPQPVPKHRTQAESAPVRPLFRNMEAGSGGIRPDAVPTWRSAG